MAEATRIRSHVCAPVKFNAAMVTFGHQRALRPSRILIAAI